MPQTPTAKVLGSVEYYGKRAAHPVSSMRGLNRRIDRRRRGANVDHEFHKAIDDTRLLADARSMGFEVVIHHRNAGGSLAITRPLWRRLRAYTTFAMLLRKPPPGH